MLQVIHAILVHHSKIGCYMSKMKLEVKLTVYEEDKW